MNIYSKAFEASYFRAVYLYQWTYSGRGCSSSRVIRRWIGNSRRLEDQRWLLGDLCGCAVKEICYLVGEQIGNVGVKGHHYDCFTPLEATLWTCGLSTSWCIYINSLLDYSWDCKQLWVTISSKDTVECEVHYTEAEAGREDFAFFKVLFIITLSITLIHCHRCELSVCG